jgi:hypothetical protein
METKSLTMTELKMDTKGAGTFEAVFASFNAIDKDQDVTEKGAFGQQDVVISQYNHGSWGKGASALPIGVGVISESGNSAIISGEFDLSDPDGVKTYNKLKYLTEKNRPVEWSYALPEIKSRKGTFDGQNVRFIEKVRVPEVSPVLMGAGVGTRLLDIKSDNPEERASKGKSISIVDHFDSVQSEIEIMVKRIKDLGELRESEGRHPSDATMKRAAQMKDSLSTLIRELEEVEVKHNIFYSEMLRFEKIKLNRSTSECLQS